MEVGEEEKGEEGGHAGEAAWGGRVASEGVRGGGASGRGRNEGVRGEGPWCEGDEGRALEQPRERLDDQARRRSRC